MTRTVLAGTILGLALLISMGTQPSAVAGKKGAAAGTVEIKEGKDGKYRFFVRDADDKLLAMSGPTGFATAAEAQKAVDALKAVIGGAKVVVEKASTKEDPEAKETPVKDKAAKDKATKEKKAVKEG